MDWNPSVIDAHEAWAGNLDLPGESKLMPPCGALPAGPIVLDKQT